MASNRRTPLHIFLSVLTGLACGLLILFMLIASFFALGLIGWSDARDNQHPDRLELTTNISMVASMLAAVSAGIFIAYKMTKPANQEKDSQDKSNDQ